MSDSAISKSAIFRFMNPNDHHVHISHRKVLATISLVDESFIHSLDDTRMADCSIANIETSKVSANPSLHFDFSDSDLTPDQRNQLECFLHTQRSVFAKDWTELGKTDLHHHEIRTGDADPVRMPFYRQSVQVRKECSEQVKEMLNAGIIEPSESEWRSPVVMVRKKDGTYRFAVDYRKLNAITKGMYFSLPRFDDVIDFVGHAQAKYFSVLDCASGFW